MDGPMRKKVEIGEENVNMGPDASYVALGPTLQEEERKCCHLLLN